MEIRVGENESLESALKRFKRKCARSGVLAEVRRREHYEKPSVKRKKKAEAAGESLSPNWNKVTLIPVETSYSTVSTTASVLTKVTHTMAFNSTKLKKGETDSDNIKISVIYSKYKE